MAAKRVPGFDSFFDMRHRVRLDIEIRMGGRFDRVTFFFGSGIDAGGNRLRLCIRRSDVEPHTKQAMTPKWRGFARFDPPPGARRDGGH